MPRDAALSRKPDAVGQRKLCEEDPAADGRRVEGPLGRVASVDRRAHLVLLSDCDGRIREIRDRPRSDETMMRRICRARHAPQVFVGLLVAPGEQHHDPAGHLADREHGATAGWRREPFRIIEKLTRTAALSPCGRQPGQSGGGSRPPRKRPGVRRQPRSGDLCQDLVSYRCFRVPAERVAQTSLPRLALGRRQVGLTAARVAVPIGPGWLTASSAATMTLP